MSRDRVISEDHLLGGMFGYRRKIFGSTGITKTSLVRNGQGRPGGGGNGRACIETLTQ